MGILFFLAAVHAFNVAFYLPSHYVILDDNNQLQISAKPFHNKNKYRLPNYEIANRFYASTFGLMNYHLSDLIKNFTPGSKTHEISKAEAKELGDFFKSKKQINDIKSPFWGIAENRNVFLIHFESLIPLLIGLKVDDIPITPTINSLISNSLYWQNIIDETGLASSSDAEFMIMTGILPDINNIVAYNPEIKKHLHSLPHILKNNGFQTISLHGFNSSFWLRNINHPIYGFDTMYFDKIFTSDEKIGWGLPDKDFFLQSAELLKAHEPPFMAYLISLSTHHPYRNTPEEYQDFFTKSIDASTMLIRYLQLIRYTDDALGDFIDAIKRQDRWDNSIFVIYGDHPPTIDEQGMADFKRVSGKDILAPRSQCVPIIIVIPGKEDYISKYRKEFDDIVGGLSDIHPTILHLLGYEIPNGIYGSHLFVPNDQRDSMPVLKYLDRFAYNGILYENSGRSPCTDKFGTVFTNNQTAIIDDEQMRIEAYKKTMRAFYLYNNIFYENFNFDLIINSFFYENRNLDSKTND